MIRVLLADDDYIVKDILWGMIPWKELNMEVIDFVENGQQALDLCLLHKPELLITDIRMPLLNGLEVALYLREYGLKTKVILISGIQDFDYARTALDVQASGYLLKPIRMKEVIATIKKVSETIELETNRAAFLDKIQTRLNDNLPLARATFLCNLLHGTFDSGNKLAEKLEYFLLPFRPDETVVAAAGIIDNYGAIAANHSEGELQMLNFAVRDIIEQSINNYQAGVSVSTQDNEFVLIFHKEYCNIDKITELLEGVFVLAKELDNLSLSFGIGLPVDGIHTVSSSYYGALKALDYKFYVGSQSIIQIDDITANSNFRSMLNEDSSLRLKTLQKELLRRIKLGDTNGVESLMEEYYHILTQPEAFTKEYIRGQFFELIIRAYRESCEAESELPELSSNYNIATRTILNAETVSDIRIHTQKMLLSIVRYFSNKYTNRHLMLTEQIKSYIEQHRSENITLNDIAQAVYMSTNYICAVFKKECGQTIHDYMLEVKMLEAKKMLEDTKLKVFEISEYLGYETPHYFSYSFKRYTGKTPYQFRKKI